MVVYPPFVGCSVTLALRSADILRWRRLFCIRHLSFSQHTARASAVRYPPISVQSTNQALVGSSVTFAPRSTDIRAFRTKKSSSLIHRWRGGCLIIVYLESRYVVLGCFVLPMGVSLTYVSYSGDRQHSHYRHRRIYATTTISHFPYICF